MNKIEPGCRCVIVNSVAGNNGIIVTVVKYLGKTVSNFTGVDVWELDKEINYRRNGVINETVNMLDEIKLKRLPDDANTLLTEGWEHATFKELGYTPAYTGVEA